MSTTVNVNSNSSNPRNTFSTACLTIAAGLYLHSRPTLPQSAQLVQEFAKNNPLKCAGAATALAFAPEIFKGLKFCFWDHPRVGATTVVAAVSSATTFYAVSRFGMPTSFLTTK